MASPWSKEVGITLDPRGEVPIGVQLDWGIRAAVAAGRLRPGERLPALRELAGDLGVNHNTLRAAVARLETDGVLESRHGSGTFVAARAAAQERQAPLVEQVVRWAGDAGLSPRDLAAALYVTEPEASERDAEAEERRALRDDIAVLDRLVVQLEARLPRLLPPHHGLEGTGSRLLTTDELREQRDALVRRLAEVQRALDAPQGDDADGPPAEAAQPEAAPEASRERRARGVPRANPGVSPA